MPQLPSGRHVGVDPQPLNALIDDIISGKAVVSWPLLAIESKMDLLAHLAIVYFEEIDDGKSFELAKGSLPIDARLKKVVTNKTVVDVFNDNSDWSDEDKSAFWEHLTSERVKPFFNSLLEHVEKVKKPY